MNDLINIETASVKVLKEELTKLGVAFKAKAKTEELRKLFSEAQDRANLGVHPANDPICDIFSNPKMSNPGCTACIQEFGKRHDACVEASEEKKKAKSAGKSSGPSTKVRGKYTNFEELKAALESAPEKRMTMVVDKLLLAGDTLKDLLSKIEERKKADFPTNNDFQSIAIIRKHISYRASKGWVFEVGENGVVKLTDYSQEPQKVSFSPPAEVKDEKKAA